MSITLWATYRTIRKNSGAHSTSCSSICLTRKSSSPPKSSNTSWNLYSNRIRSYKAFRSSQLMDSVMEAIQRWNSMCKLFETLLIRYSLRNQWSNWKMASSLMKRTCSKTCWRCRCFRQAATTISAWASFQIVSTRRLWSAMSSFCFWRRRLTTWTNGRMIASSQLCKSRRIRWIIVGSSSRIRGRFSSSFRWAIISILTYWLISDQEQLLRA